MLKKNFDTVENSLLKIFNQVGGLKCANLCKKAMNEPMRPMVKDSKPLCAICFHTINFCTYLGVLG